METRENRWIRLKFIDQLMEAVMQRLGLIESRILTGEEVAASAVKSINGVEPDENGNVDVHQVTNVVFFNMDGELTVTRPIEEIIALFSSSRDYPGARFEQKLYSMTNPMAPVPSYYHQRLEADIKQNYNTGEILKNVIRIYFAPEVPDILVDCLAKTVVLDPDWTPPSENSLTEERVIALIQTELGVIENGTY